MSQRTVRRLAVIVATVAILRYVAAGGARPALARAARRGSTTLRYWSGRLQGLSYQLSGHHPDPDVPDDVLADRVRSTLGPLHKRLDIPRVQVYVVDRTAYVHGHMPSHEAAAEVIDTAAAVAGIVHVESYLHIHPIEADQLPSSGARHPAESPARKRLLASAQNAGAPPEVAPQVVGAALGFLADHVPTDEFEQFASHLPDDVLDLCDQAAPAVGGRERVRTVPELVASLAPATAPLSNEVAEHVIESVFGTLRDLVPEEDRDIGAVLPDDLREFWLASMGH